MRLSALLQLLAVVVALVVLVQVECPFSEWHSNRTGAFVPESRIRGTVEHEPGLH